METIHFIVQNSNKMQQIYSYKQIASNTWGISNEYYPRIFLFDNVDIENDTVTIHSLSDLRQSIGLLLNKETNMIVSQDVTISSYHNKSLTSAFHAKPSSKLSSMVDILKDDNIKTVSDALIHYKLIEAI